MQYVISDIHGMYDKYAAMLDTIGFSEEDTLYVLGDVLDRGPEPVRILRDMAVRPNVYPILGNHEIMALSVLKDMCVDITADNWTRARYTACSTGSRRAVPPRWKDSTRCPRRRAPISLTICGISRPMRR